MRVCSNIVHAIMARSSNELKLNLIMPFPIASVIVCSKNGESKIRQCLFNLAAIRDIKDVEVVLVDNGSKDQTYQIMKEFASTSRGIWRTFNVEKIGCSAARNVAIANSNSDILIFIDDDCLVDFDFVVSWTNIFRAHQNLGYASGKIIPFGDSVKLGCKSAVDREIFKPGKLVKRGFIQGSNMAFRRSCLDEIGNFDEAFGAGTEYAGEEWDLAIRASQYNWTGGYFPSPVVIHNHGRENEDAFTRLLFYDHGAGAIYAKHLFAVYWPMVLRTMASDVFHRLTNLARLSSLLRGFINYNWIALNGVRL